MSGHLENASEERHTHQLHEQCGSLCKSQISRPCGINETAVCKPILTQSYNVGCGSIHFVKAKDKIVLETMS